MDNPMGFPLPFFRAAGNNNWGFTKSSASDQKELKICFPLT